MALTSLTPEQIEKYKLILKETSPYTEEEVINIPFDSNDYDWKRLKAYMAKKTLREAGLLEE